MEQDEVRKLYSCYDCSPSGPNQSWVVSPRDLLFVSTWTSRALYPSFFSEDTGVHHCPTEKKNHSKKTRPPENHWYKSLNSASGTIIVIFFSEIKKRNFSSATNSCSENVPGGVQLVQFNYFHLQIDSLAMRKLLVVLLINSRFLLSLLCCGGAGEYIQRENEKFLMSCIR